LKPHNITLFEISSFATLLLSLALTNIFDGKNALAQVASPISATSPSSLLFLTYQNLTAGFKIEYPSYWQKSENISSNYSAVYFSEPISGARFSVTNFKIPQTNLLNEPKNLILSSYLNAFTQPFQPYNLTQSASTTLVGNPANRTELTYTSTGGPSRAMILSSISGDKVYILSYAASIANYALFLPTAQEMINSLAILPITSTSPTSITSK
jgi:hypothetical protein